MTLVAPRASDAERRRLNELFAELCAIPSVSGQEAAVSARVVELLDAAGLASQTDAAGNILTRVGDPDARASCSAPTSTPSRTATSRSSR